MLSKANCLNRLFVRNIPILNKNIKLSTLHKNLPVLVPKVRAQKIHTTFLINNDSQKIISSQHSAKSPLSDDLKNIINKNIGQDSQEEEPKGSQNDKKNDQKENEDDSKFSRMFSREHAWKFSLGFFGALFGGSFFYVLVYWGSPKLDENNKPTKDEYSDCKN